MLVRRAGPRPIMLMKTTGAPRKVILVWWSRASAARCVLFASPGAFIYWYHAPDNAPSRRDGARFANSDGQPCRVQPGGPPVALF